MESADKNALLDTAVRAAGLAGELILVNLGGLSPEDIGSKLAADFVTRVDRDSEEIIIRAIKDAFPDHSILSEESVKDAETERYRWIIDPLDGTTNYIHQYPVFAVSIAVQYGGETVMGVVLDPLRGELFHALKGHGAFLNRKPIGISAFTAPGSALVTTGFPFREKEMLDPYLLAFKRIFLRVSGIRRAGSAALDLAYLASGRCDGFFELGLKPWDIAAGALLIEEAGGVVTDFGGGGGYLKTGNIVAAVPGLHEELLGEIKAVFSGIIEK
jgi:myo-inositol-1(or 4)-monophosphatase